MGGLTIHVSHFPPGTSKWNKIEHRLFNHISMNWKGQPLVSLDVIINLIGNTTSRTGLKVYAMEDRNSYPTKRKISDKEMEKINIVKHDSLGKWNYTIRKARKHDSYESPTARTLPAAVRLTRFALSLSDAKRSVSTHAERYRREMIQEKTPKKTLSHRI